MITRDEFRKIAANGIWKQNTSLVQILGLCPLLAVSNEGQLLTLRVTQHKETPGLGDYIEPKKDKNKARPWITQFDGTNPATGTEREWKVKKDGGHFDSMAGATVTPRAVIKAVRKAILHVVANREALFASQP